MSTAMADATTPLIANCWYVAAWSHEVSREMLSRSLLGRQLVLYRRIDGTAVALADRCPHRAMPLSMGCLEGDEVRCGYHGLRFDAEGLCTDAPPVPKPPRAMRVASFPLVEKGPLLWIWPGDPALADPAAVPECGWLEDAAFTYASGSMTIAANYVALQENLLDLTHFTFLHPGNLGTPEYASAPYRVTSDSRTVTVVRTVPECGLPAMYEATGLGSKRISRCTTSQFLSPALHAAHVLLTDLAPDPGERATYTVHITHFVTPCDQDNTHYFFTAARDYALGDEEATETMRRNTLKAFVEDKVALEAIADLQKREGDLSEMSMQSDQAGVTMRRILLAMAEAETAARLTQGGDHPGGA